MWGALKTLGAQRIDHGVHALDDPTLVDYMAQHQVPITLCPVSNSKLKVGVAWKLAWRLAWWCVEVGVTPIFEVGVEIGVGPHVVWLGCSLSTSQSPNFTHDHAAPVHLHTRPPGVWRRNPAEGKAL